MSTHIFMFVSTHMFTYMSVYMHAHAHVYTHVYVHVCTHVYTHVYAHVHTHVYTLVRRVFSTTLFFADAQANRMLRGLYIGSISASPTACLFRGYGRAGTQNDRLSDSYGCDT